MCQTREDEGSGERVFQLKASDSVRLSLSTRKLKGARVHCAKCNLKFLTSSLARSSSPNIDSMLIMKSQPHKLHP